MAMTIKAARVNAGLTQEEARCALGISRNTIVNYEKYKTKVPVETAKKMAALYGVTVDDIIFFK